MPEVRSAADLPSEKGAPCGARLHRARRSLRPTLSGFAQRQQTADRIGGVFHAATRSVGRYALPMYRIAIGCVCLWAFFRWLWGRQLTHDYASTTGTGTSPAAAHVAGFVWGRDLAGRRGHRARSLLHEPEGRVLLGTALGARRHARGHHCQRVHQLRLPPGDRGH